MSRYRRATVASREKYETLQHSEVSLSDEIKEYLKAPPLLSSYINREIPGDDMQLMKTRWFCQLKGEQLLGAAVIKSRYCFLGPRMRELKNVRLRHALLTCASLQQAPSLCTGKTRLALRILLSHRRRPWRSRKSSQRRKMNWHVSRRKSFFVKSGSL